MSSQDISNKASEITGQAQMKKDEVADKATEACRSVGQSCQEIKDQAGSYVQKGCEQVKSVAKGAVDAAHSALGAGSDSNPASKR